MSMLKVAAVQAAPVWMDREATLEKAVGLVREAGDEGAGLVAFSETFVPGYPWWVLFDDLDVTVSSQTQARQTWYLNGGVDLADDGLDPVVEAARESGIFVSIGVAELAPTGGSVWCLMVMISPERGIVGVHRKLKPTSTERIAWADGDGHGLEVHSWAGWKIGGLNCWENWLPLPRFTLYSQGEQLHIASWPGGTRLAADITRFVAMEGGMYVISASGLFNSSLVPDGFPGAGPLAEAFLEELPFGDGGTLIVDPTGRVLAEAEQHQEQIIYADLDLDAAVAARTLRDQGGHYHRPDVFDLSVNRKRLTAVELDD